MPDTFPLPHYAMPPGTAGPTPKGIMVERDRKMAKGVAKLSRHMPNKRMVAKMRKPKRFF